MDDNHRGNRNTSRENRFSDPFEDSSSSNVESTTGHARFRNKWRNRDDIPSSNHSANRHFAGAPQSNADPVNDMQLTENESFSEEEELLASVLSEITDRQSRGEHVDINEYCRFNPGISVELRQLFAAIVVTETAGKKPSDGSESWGDQDPDADNLIECPHQFGEFELIEEIGRGGMGVVFKARHLRLNRIVAMKMILQGELASPDDRQRFMAEAHAAAKLQHKSIVSVYEVGQHDGKMFFCMEYIAGKTLLQELANGPLSPRRATKILLQISRAIAYAHEQGVLHRDLKPSNILIAENGDAKITDFGLAKQVTSNRSITLNNMTLTGAVIGTPSYMSPEQAAGSRIEIGPTSDIYSLGSILYHMLTGRPPFQASSPMDTLLMVMEQDPIPPRILNRNTDHDLEMITLRCLQKPPELRYETGYDLAADLNAFLKDEPISARSGRISHLLARMFRETHNAHVLENWGLLWMWHSLVLLIASFATNILQLAEVKGVYQYPILWIAGLGAWAVVFWYLRRRMGPVTFVERQIAHVWASSMICVAGLFPIEMFLGLGPLELSPCLGLIAGSTFLIKGGILSGTFYIQACALFATSLLMAAFPNYSHFIFGVVAGLCFFIPGLKYYRQRRSNELAKLIS